MDGWMDGWVDGRVPSGGAWQGPLVGRLRTAGSQSAAPTGTSPYRFFYGAFNHRQYTVPLCLGVRGPGILELRNTHVSLNVPSLVIYLSIYLLSRALWPS